MQDPCVCVVLPSPNSSLPFKKLGAVVVSVANAASSGQVVELFGLCRAHSNLDQ